MTTDSETVSYYNSEAADAFIEGSATIPPDPLVGYCAETLQQFSKISDVLCVDLGCGFGRQLLDIANKFGANATVVGFEQSPYLLSKADELMHHGRVQLTDGRWIYVNGFTPGEELSDWDNIQLIHGDVLDLESHISSNSVDFINSNCTHLHLGAEDLSDAMNEVYRVLKPEGIMLLRMKTPIGNQTSRTRADGRTEYYYSSEYWQSILESVGFEVIKVQAGDNLDVEYTKTSQFMAIVVRKISL